MILEGLFHRTACCGLRAAVAGSSRLHRATGVSCAALPPGGGRVPALAAVSGGNLAPPCAAAAVTSAEPFLRCPGTAASAHLLLCLAPLPL